MLCAVNAFNNFLSELLQVIPGTIYLLNTPCGCIVCSMDKMNNNTLRITTGAMILAIFAILLLLNRQTGGVFEGFFIYILPVPMVIYSAKFDWKSGLLVFAGMCAFSIFFGTLTSIFYAVSSALLGLIFGACLFKKVDMTITMFIVMGMAGVLSVVSNVALASVFGYNLSEDIALMQNSMTEALAKANVDVAGGPYAIIFSDSSMLQLFIISMVLAGLLDGFIVYQLSILILKRLHYPLEPRKPVAEIYPPKWTGVAAVIAYVYGSTVFLNPNSTHAAQSVGQTLWVVGYLYLAAFGIIAAALFMKRRLRLNRLVVTLLCVLCMFVFPQLMIIMGLMYISFSLHDHLLEPARIR